MEHYRLRKYRGPETWRKVREAYVAGEPAPSVARRFDVGLDNIRKRAMREGWTRNRIAAGLESERDLVPPLAGPAPPPTDPETARRGAIERAAALLAGGRGAEATVLLKAAEAFGRMTETDADAPAFAAPSPADDAAREAAGQAAWDAINQEVERRADQLARQLLTDPGPSSVDHGHFALRWRAEMLGPEVAAHDLRRAEDGGWARQYWDEEGRLRPRAEVMGGIWDDMRGTARTALGLPAARQTS